VLCLSENRKQIAVGLSNFSSEELSKIKGLRTDKIEQVLGYKEVDEVLHRNNLVVL
jgi:glutamate 5-kinase